MSEGEGAALPRSGWYADPDGDPKRVRYWDGQRWTDQYAEGRVEKTNERPLPLGTLSRVAIGALVLVALSYVFTIIADLNRVSLDQTFLDGSAINSGDITRAKDLDDTAALLRNGSTILCAIAFLMWFYRAYSNLPRLGLSQLRYNVDWSVGAWFIPFFNLVRPKQIANDIYRGSNPELPPRTNFWQEPGSALLDWWWGMLILSGVVGGIGGAIASTDTEHVTSAVAAFDAIRDERNGTIVAAVGAGLAIVAAILAIRVILTITEREEEAARRREQALANV